MFKTAQRKSLRGLLALALSCLYISACSGDPVASDDAAAAYYTQAQASRDGIGKFYMGREISHVMGHLGAGWLERPDRERDERTDLLIENLPLQSDFIVADIGAGTGYFSLPMARRVPDGKVLAVDIQQEMLDIIAARKNEQGLNNIELRLATEGDPRLPAGSVDLVLLVDAYHEFSFPREVMQHVHSGLKPGGKVVLIEYRGEDRWVPIKELHKMTQKQAKKEMAAVGLAWVETKDFLPQQHFMLFEKPPEQ